MANEITQNTIALCALTHWGQDQMADILQSAFWNAFSRMKYVHFDENTTEVCSEGSKRQYINIGSGNDLALSRWQTIP